MRDRRDGGTAGRRPQRWESVAGTGWRANATANFLDLVPRDVVAANCWFAWVGELEQRATRTQISSAFTHGGLGVWMDVP